MHAIAQITQKRQGRALDAVKTSKEVQKCVSGLQYLCELIKDEFRSSF